MSRWQSYYGQRYLFVREFVRLSNSLGIRTTERELEHFHRIGLLYPVLQLQFPQEFVRSFYPEMEESIPDAALKDYPYDWQELNRLHKLLRFRFWDAYRILFHPFDKSTVRDKRFITIPSEVDFVPWKAFQMELKHELYGDLTPSTIRLFYSCWQVYQLEAIKRNPSWSKYWTVLQRIPENERKWYFRPPPKKRGDFLGKNKYFDCYSFYRFSRINQYGAFVFELKKQGKDLITSQQKQWLNSRYRKLAQVALRRFSLNVEEMEEFLHFCVKNIHQTLEARGEKALLPLCKRDLAYLSEMIMVLTGRNFDELKNIPHFEGLKKVFPNEIEARINHVKRYFKTISLNYNKVVPSKYQMSEQEITKLADHISREITVWGIIESVYLINKKFRAGDLISVSQVKDSLGALCQYFEPFLRGLYNMRKRRPNKSLNTNLPRGCVTHFFAKERRLKDVLRNKWEDMTHFKQDDPANNFEQKLAKIAAMPKNSFKEEIAATIFKTVLVGNFLRHRAEFYFDHVRYNEQLADHVLGALFSIFFAWIYNQHNYKLK